MSRAKLEMTEYTGPSRRAEDQRLSMTVSGLCVLFNSIIQEVTLVRAGQKPGPVSEDRLMALAEHRMPEVFSAGSDVRGESLAALEKAVELALHAPEPDGGFQWPLDPNWLTPLVNEVVGDLLHSFAFFNVHVPGGTNFLNRMESERLPQVEPWTDDRGRFHAWTRRFISMPEDGRKIQLQIRREGPHMLLATREKGQEEFKTFLKLPTIFSPFLRALMASMEQNNRSPI
jgi:hypothetical protein